MPQHASVGQVDVLVLEVGMGGRYDATNVVEQPVACAVNTLDLEHTAQLGDTIEKIAWEKGGIIKRRVPCFVAPQRHQTGLRILRGRSITHPAAHPQ
jgi:folylpolyglutamate synthase/dihydropteroate synthase